MIIFDYLSIDYMKLRSLAISCLLIPLGLFGQYFTTVDVCPDSLMPGAPAGYYQSAEGLSGHALRQSLHEIIDDHESKSYSSAWQHFEQTDRKADGKVWDIYSDNPSGPEPYEYQFNIDQGGSANSEGDGFSREHSFPKSWFGGSVLPMNSDLFALYPCDIYVNNNRSNHPYGEVDQPVFTSMNGSKRGANVYPGYSGTVFEPIDEYKGDLARTYFYMATRYLGEGDNWPGSGMIDGTELRQWAINMLLEWSSADPVSQKEIDRNNAIFGVQENRNPFIDCAEYAEMIWQRVPVSIGEVPDMKKSPLVYPNPITSGSFSLDIDEAAQVAIFNLQGQRLFKCTDRCKVQLKGELEQLPSGVYQVLVGTGFEAHRQKLVKAAY